MPLSMFIYKRFEIFLSKTSRISWANRFLQMHILWLHELEVPVFGSLAIINSTSEWKWYVYFHSINVHAFALCDLNESSFLKLSLYNVLYIYLLIFCTVFHSSYLLLSGWS